MGSGVSKGLSAALEVSSAAEVKVALETVPADLKRKLQTVLDCQSKGQSDSPPDSKHEWMSSGDTTFQSDVCLHIENMTGEPAAVVHMSLQNTVWEVKGHLEEITAIPQGKQQLVLKDSVLKNKAYLYECGICGPDAVLMLIRRVTVPKLSELELLITDALEVGTENLSTRLQDLFQLHDLNEPILVRQGWDGSYAEEGFDEESGFHEEYDPVRIQLEMEAAEKSMQEEEAFFKRFGPSEGIEDLGLEAGAPALRHLADMSWGIASPGILCSAAKWMLLKGASPDAEWKGKSVVQLFLQAQNAALLGDLLAAGAAKPNLTDLLSAFPTDDELLNGGNMWLYAHQPSTCRPAWLEFLDLIQEQVKSHPMEELQIAFPDHFDAANHHVWRKVKFLELGMTPATDVLGWWSDKQSDMKMLASSLEAAVREACHRGTERLSFDGLDEMPDDLKTRFNDFRKLFAEAHGEDYGEADGDEF